MKIAMLARNPTLYSHKRLVEAAESRGHQIDITNTLRCYMNIASRRSEIYYNGEKLEGYDAVIPRIGASVTFYGTAVLRQFEMMGVYPLNESVAIGRSRDKLRSMQLLARDGIGLPVTNLPMIPSRPKRWWPLQAVRRWSSSCWKARRGWLWFWQIRTDPQSR